MATQASEVIVKAIVPVASQSKPLSFILQGQIATASKIMFLLPDGSGSGMAYAKIPKIDPSVCLIALNSPFLQTKGESFSVEGIAALWSEEIRRRQPTGPYILGGWSAGGYYSFEATKDMMRRGLEVSKLILIDTPCRLDYEELPMEVVHFLSDNNLMGNWGVGKPPQWMTDHFEISIEAMANYTPSPLESSLEVYIIWAQDGVLKNAGSINANVDFRVKVTNLMLNRPINLGPLGWDQLFPDAETLAVANMPGNHFTVVHPPNSSALGILLRDIALGLGSDSQERWEQF